VVRVIIEAALVRGWQPAQRGLPAFRVRDAEQLALMGEQDPEPSAAELGSSTASDN
jgi:hypothetical protein